MRRGPPPFAVLAVVLLASACASRGAAESGSQAPRSLDGRTFLSTIVLEQGVERPLVPGTRVELSFSDGRLSVRAGCNIMGAEYQIEGDVLRLVGDVSTTEIGCDPPRHEQDEWISGLLGDSPRFLLEGDELVLVRGGTEVRLLDRTVADPDLPLMGTTWKLETILQSGTASSVPVGASATLRFPDGRTVEVDTGCNLGGGTVEIEEGTLIFGPITLTARACQGPAAELERQVLAVLTSPEVEYSIQGSLLSLRVGDRGLDWLASRTRLP
jgi:heat shock protein HslJ